MSTVSDSGTYTPAALTTDYTVTTAISAAGTYVVVINTTNYVNGDTVEFSLKRKVISSGSVALAARIVLSNAQSCPCLISDPIVLPANCSLEFHVNQTGGTLRAFEWSIEKV